MKRLTKEEEMKNLKRCNWIRRELRIINERLHRVIQYKAELRKELRVLDKQSGWNT